MTEDIYEWEEYGRRKVCLDQTFGILELWSTFLSLLGSLSLRWIEGGRTVRRRGGDPLFTLPLCLGWSLNKAGLSVGYFSLLLGIGMSRYEM